MAKRSISIACGVGCIAHNLRRFVAKNVDTTRSYLNRVLVNCMTTAKKAFNTFFMDVVDRYNARQKNPSKRIIDYYDKVSNDGRNIKPIREMFVMIGNMNVSDAEPETLLRVAYALEEFFYGFIKRNPTMYVVCAVLHMDEATPHLHITFIPFGTGYKRGMDTQVSFSRALSQIDYLKDVPRYSRFRVWIQREKEELALVMERYGFSWEKLGTHEKHMPIEAYRESKRQKELEALDGEIASKQEELERLVRAAKGAATAIGEAKAFASMIDDPERGLPKPGFGVSGAAYYRHTVEPFMTKANAYMSCLAARSASLEKKCEDLFNEKQKLENENSGLKMANHMLHKANKAREEDSDDLLHLKNYLREQGFNVDAMMASWKGSRKRQKTKDDILR